MLIAAVCGLSPVTMVIVKPRSWKAPMSMLAPGRATPRWSVVGTVTPAMVALPVADGGAAGQEGDGLGRARRCSAARRAEPRVGDADLVAVDAVDQAAGAAGADQVVRAG